MSMTGPTMRHSKEFHEFRFAIEGRTAELQARIEEALRRDSRLAADVQETKASQDSEIAQIRASIVDVLEESRRLGKEVLDTRSTQERERMLARQRIDEAAEQSSVLQNAFLRIQVFEKQYNMIKERVDQMEQNMEDVFATGKPTSEIAQRLNSIEESVSIVGELRKSYVSLRTSVDSFSHINSEWESRHMSLEAQLKTFEDMFTGTLDKHMKEIDWVREKTSRELDHVKVERRLDGIEMVHSEFDGKVCNMLKEVTVRTDTFGSRIASLEEICEDVAHFGGIVNDCSAFKQTAELRFISLERLLNEYDQQGGMLNVVHSKLDQAFNRISAVEEQSIPAMAEVKKNVHDLSSKVNGLVNSLDSHRAALSDKVHQIEVAWNETFGPSLRESQEALVACAEKANLIDDMKERMDVIIRSVQELEHKHQTSTEHVALDLSKIDARVAACEAREAREVCIQDLKSAYSSLTNGATVMEIRVQSLKDRQDTIESRLGNVAERRQSQEAEAVRNANSVALEASTTIKQVHAQQSIIADRVDYMEALFTETNERLTDKVSTLHADLGHLRSRMEERGKMLLDLQGAQVKLEDGKASVENTQALQKHLNTLERAVVDLLSKPGKADAGSPSEARPSPNHRFHARLEEVERLVSEAMSVHARSMEALKASREQARSVTNRIESLETCVVGSVGTEAADRLHRLEAFVRELATTDKLEVNRSHIEKSPLLSADSLGGRSTSSCGLTSWRDRGVDSKLYNATGADELESATVEAAGSSCSPDSPIGARAVRSSPPTSPGCFGRTLFASSDNYLSPQSPIRTKFPDHNRKVSQSVGCLVASAFGNGESLRSGSGKSSDNGSPGEAIAFSDNVRFSASKSLSSDWLQRFAPGEKSKHVP